MNPVIPLDHIHEEHREFVGGKALAMAAMAQEGILVPDAVCVTVLAYQEYVATTGLAERIFMELNRKDFTDMRWEEMWDASLRIRNMFLNASIPLLLEKNLRLALEPIAKKGPVVVRSSSLEEDSSKVSFAGLHESYVNVKGIASILDHIKLVWASLWSDAALLYRQELSLSPEKSAMAVIVQDLIQGDKSGVAFGQNPHDESQAVIEAVYGLNQGLVDGTIEPDRWIIDRATGRIISHTPALRKEALFALDEGVRLQSLPFEKQMVPPLSNTDLKRVYELVRRLEFLFGAPQDVEWTQKGPFFYALQTRPITTLPGAPSEDKRAWYLSLRRSFRNLVNLRKKIENEHIPAMVSEANQLATQNLKILPDNELAEKIKKRSHLYQKWVDIYWADFIPLAHGVRLFGQVYNDIVHPSDPYEFMDLLGTTEMIGMKRNSMLEQMASLIRNDHILAKSLKSDIPQIINEEFEQRITEFLHEFGYIFCHTSECDEGRRGVIRMAMKLAERKAAERRIPARGKKSNNLRDSFFSLLKNSQRTYAAELLDLAKASYRLRDDDNIYLGKIEEQLSVALGEGKRRIENRGIESGEELTISEVIRALENPHVKIKRRKEKKAKENHFSITMRQLRGQPASPGVVRGKARVIAHPSDVFSFKAEEILVCDAIDPNMTLIVPLSSGIVERRGGMLIHGAIIAREYGIPCVTGIPEATEYIQTGDSIIVDGDFGIVTIANKAAK